jgi:hypothetical protein
MSRSEVALALATLVCLLTGCSGGAPVMAQSSYSNASLSGTYGFSFNSTGGADLTNPNGSQSPYGAVGTLQFNGSGNVSAGTITAYTASGSCAISLTGNYSIENTGLGQITVAPVVTSGGCAVPSSWKAMLTVTQQGGSFSFASSPGTAGSAAKQ